MKTMHPATTPMVLLAALLTAGAAQAAQVIKVGTVAPRGSAWAKAMDEMAEAFHRHSSGQVELRVYPGTVGDEPTILRKIRVNQLQGAVLTSTGLSLISPAPMALQLPMLFDSFAELDRVRSALEPELERRLAEAGFAVLAWGDAGWLQVFSKKPARTPADFKGTKIWMWANDPGAVEVFQQIGFSPVVLSSVDMIPSLQTGMIDAVPATPMVALSVQAYRQAPHMLEVNWAPVIGAIVISKKAWDAIPDSCRPQIKAACAEIGARLRAEVRTQTADAVAAMVKNGLVVHRLDDAQRELWRAEALRAQQLVRGRSIDAALIDRVIMLRDAARAPASKPGP
ncbi:MAG: TRAP transporter substrate-binding protein DctP [Deltaproteobacteria bacterium]|nr:TRAP transporter substrate-binding protein DctP [Deltaproteobacteria bacterium]